MLETMQELIVEYPWLSLVVSFLNILLVPIAIILYYRVVAPRLAKSKYITKELREMLRLNKSAEERNKAVQASTDLLFREVDALKRAMLTAFTNSNLSESVKSLIRIILSGSILDNKDIIKEKMSDLSDEGKEAFEETIEGIKDHMKEDERTALQRIQAELDEERDDE